MDTLHTLPLNTTDQRLLERYNESPTDPITLAQLAGLALRYDHAQQAEELFVNIGETPGYDPDTTKRILFIQAQIAARQGNAGAAWRLFEEAAKTPGDQAVIMEATRKELEWRFRS